ncbi:uncharacterized protein LOC142616395 [Castanea sativa]|uniref:uncharacterized protein LOC142616395 n=1 Tax=Castanea sativa TaxID=21020 RepID=UPI003F65097F
MTETHSTSQNSNSQSSEKQNSKKIATLAKVSKNHEYALQAIQKQLQTITRFMQRITEAEDKHQISNSGSQALLINSNGGNPESSPFNSLKNLKLDFPRFRGENPTCWVYKANQFFSYHNTPEHHKTRFGVSAYDDPMVVLTRLKQTSTMIAYKGNFEILSNRIFGLSESHKLSCFLSGLRDKIRLPVRMLVPKTLNEAFGLVKIQEEYLSNGRERLRNLMDSGKGSVLGTPTLEARVESRTKVPLQRLTGAQMEERRKLGLCYNCDEKWQMGHKCKGAKLFLLEEVIEVEPKPSEVHLVEIKEDEVLLDNQDGSLRSGVDLAEIILYALVGNPTSNTIRIKGRIQNRDVVSLIDSESNHNFLDAVVLPVLHLQLDTSQILEVRVADGTILKTLGSCHEVPITLQGHRKGLVLQINATDSVASVQSPLPPKLVALLGEFSQVFVIPTGLPPIKGHEHSTNLKEDYRALNKATIKDKFPIPVVDELLDELAGASMFSKLDLSQSLDAYLSHLRTVLEVLLSHQLFAKQSMCVFGSSKVEYLGHIISSEGVKADPKKISAMVQWPIPDSVKALRGFLGLTGYYRKFIKGYGSIAQPLTDLLKKDYFLWSDKALEAFTRLKEVVTYPLVLAQPDFSKPIILECDASRRGLGAVLMQDQRPIAFHIQALKAKYFHLSTYETESMVLASTRIATPSQQKWLAKLLGYAFVVEYKRGCDNRVADALSRQFRVDSDLPATSFDSRTGCLMLLTVPDPTWLDGLKASYSLDASVQQLIAAIQAGSPPKGFTFQNGLLFYKGRFFVGPSCPLKL